MLESTLKALAALRASEAMPLGQGLSAEHAQLASRSLAWHANYFSPRVAIFATAHAPS